MTLPLLVLIASLLLAAFAAAAETSLTSVSRLTMRSQAEAGNLRAKKVVALHDRPNDYLSTILTINTVAIIVASTAAPLLAITMPNLPSVAITLFLSLFILIFCEIAPKSFALRFNVWLATHLAAPVSFLTNLLRPIISSLTFLATLPLRATTKGKALPGPFMTEQDLRHILALGAEEGVVEHRERLMIHGILEMTDKTASDIMVPRVDIIGLSVNAKLESLLGLIRDHGHSRIVIYEHSLDNTIGIVHAKDLLLQNVTAEDTRPIRTFMHPPYFVPGSLHLGELLNDLQERKTHLAIVVDEHGGTAGLVSLEDLLEEIVGPIRDEYDQHEKQEISRLSPSEVILSARYPTNQLLPVLGIEIGPTESETLGGLMYERLGEIPLVGASLIIGAATFTVVTLRRQSIKSVRITSSIPFPAVS